jgi:hypothetical protein
LCSLRAVKFAWEHIEILLSTKQLSMGRQNVRVFGIQSIEFGQFPFAFCLPGSRVLELRYLPEYSDLFHEVL